jgi:phage terminase large subunit-like protein
MTKSIKRINPLKLRDWQKDMIQQVYGDTDVKTALLSGVRKNGKSEMIGALMLALYCQEISSAKGICKFEK